MKKHFNPGELSSRISFLEKVPGQDDYGDPIDVWNLFKSAWAKKFDLIGTDFYAAQTSDTKIEVKFTCRYTKGITKYMRVQHGSDIYEIVGVPIDVDDEHAQLLIYCKAVQ
ncbi:MAG: head-tail adaptor protein [Herbinix sp.]|jgi:SPP1 family predicted phage head-tail adaptor|nr:head-tail adaptor protein [Herbinix sp.]